MRVSFGKMEVRRRKSGQSQTVYYEGGKITELTEQPEVFKRLYSSKKGRPVKSFQPSPVPMKKQRTPRQPASTLASSLTLPSQPLLQSSKSSLGKSIPQAIETEKQSPEVTTSRPFAEIRLQTPPADFITSRPRHSQKVALVLTEDLRKSMSLRLKSIQPEIPDRMPVAQVYQRLLAKAKHPGACMRLATEPIITPHYCQLSPALATYSYASGCAYEVWKQRISLLNHS